MIAIAILTAFAAGLHFGRIGEKRTQSRFRPVPTSIRCHVRYIEGDEATVSAMRNGCAL